MEILEQVKKRFWLIILATVFFYVMLIFVSDAEKISKHFLEIRIEFLFLIFGLVFLSHVVKSFRQKDFLNLLGTKISSSQNIIIYMAGLSLINTPGGVGSFIKSLYLKENGVSAEKSIAIIFMERFHDLLAGTTIIVVSLAVYLGAISISLAVISSIILIGTFLLVKKQAFAVFVVGKLSKIRFISKYVPEVGPSKSFSVLTRPDSMARGWMISVVGWGIDSLAVYVVFLALNVDLGYLLTSQIYFTSLGYGVLSFLPGGIGVYESIADLLLVQQGLELFVASSLVILTRLCTMWFGTVIGIIFTRIALKQKL